MIQISNKKQKRLFLLVTSFFILIFAVEIIPRFMDLSVKSINHFANQYKISSSDEYDNIIETKTIKNTLLQKKIAQIVSDYEESKKISSIFKILDKQASKADLQINSITPLKLSKKENLWLLPIKIKIKSNYEKIYNLVRFIENTSKVVVFKNKKKKKKTFTDDKVEVELLIDVYLNI